MIPASREEALGDPLALSQAVDRPTGAPAGADHAIGVVEHHYGLAALLEERPPAGRVAIHPHRVLTDG